MEEHSNDLIWVLSVVFEERLSKDDAAEGAGGIGVNIVIITLLKQDLARRESSLSACPIDGFTDRLGVLG